jgi:hypothetical protein
MLYMLVLLHPNWVVRAPMLHSGFAFRLVESQNNGASIRQPLVDEDQAPILKC